MTRERLKREIRKKFGTFTRFCRSAQLDYYEFKREFLDAARVDKADLVIIEARLNDTKGPDEFTDDLRKSLQEAINEYGGVLIFCMANAQFTASTLFAILSDDRSGDNKAYNRITPTIKQLLDHFNIKP